MTEVATAYVSLLPSAQGFGRRLNGEIGPQVTRAGRDSGRQFSNGMAASTKGLGKKVFGGLAASIATLGLGSVLKGPIDQASDLNEAGTKTEAIFGKAGKALVDQFAGKGAAALGQSRLDVMNAAATFGTFGKAAGLGGKDLAKFSTGFATLSTDLASFSNTTPEEAVEAIGAALRGEAEPIRKYGVLLDDATLRAEALKLGLIKTTKQALTPQQKVLAAQAAIYKQTTDAQGDFRKTSGGLANQQRILKARFTDLKATIGAALLPTATRFVKFLNDKLVPGIVGIGKVLFARDYTGALRKAFGWEEDSGIVTFLFKVRDGFVTAFQAAKSFFGAMFTGDATSGEMEKFAAAGVKVRDFLVAAKDKAVDFAKWLKGDLWPALKDGYRTILPGLAKAWDIISGGTGKGGVNGAKMSFSDLGKVITDKVIPFLAKLINVWLPTMAVQIRSTIEVVKGLWKVFTTGFALVGDGIAFLLRTFGNVARVWSGILSALGHVPGFEWASDAAKKLDGAAKKADDVARAIDNIQSKTVDVNVKYNVMGTGQVKLEGGALVDMGQWKAREHGGPVRKGQPYIVGEKRPELFVPNQSGKIIPKVPNGDGSRTYEQPINIYGDVRSGDALSFEREMRERQRLARLGRRRA